MPLLPLYASITWTGTTLPLPFTSSLGNSVTRLYNSQTLGQKLTSVWRTGLLLLKLKGFLHTATHKKAKATLTRSLLLEMKQDFGSKLFNVNQQSDHV